MDSWEVAERGRIATWMAEEERVTGEPRESSYISRVN